MEPSISFDLENDLESQFDFPITPMTFLFRCFENIEKSLISDSAVNWKLFLFYLKYAKPQYETWSLKRIVAVKPGLPVQTKYFLKIQFKGFRGFNHILDEFTLADLPFMNPYNWIPLFYIIMKDENKYEPILAHFKRMIICYILEISKMDVKISSVLKKRPILKPLEQPKDIQKLKVGAIQKEHWSIVYKRKDGDVVQNYMFFLRDKHLYSSAASKTILSLAEACKANFVAELKCFSYMRLWYLYVSETHF